MRKVAVKELTLENFNVYGTFTNILEPQAPKLVPGPGVDFFRDLLQLNLGQTNIASFSTLRVTKRPEIIDATEYHTHCGEVNLPLDGDIVIHVGPATANGVVPLDEIEVFRVPKGTLVAIHPGVWHHAPFAVNTDVVCVLIVLPERVYANDCTVYQIPGDKKIEVNR